ncbi:MAG TPA: HEAT repeat domain-containing protein [Planctomycetota bacterium]|jgi:tetratricopeptide (TPR) repeat protein/DNA-binding NarL/FixJ family response regulator|nr:HEAT repeat domain-containing protein [Planctomycetota bacterium]
MTGLRRNLGLVIALSSLTAPVWAGPLGTQDVKSTFDQGVEMLQRGHHDEALAAFQKVLAMDPTQEQAYELWKSSDPSVWRDLLVEGGQFELTAKRLIELARLARKTHANDPAAIQPLVVTVATDADATARRKALLTLSADHGEYAVPYLLPYLGGENGDEDRRVLAMHALSQMDTDVVAPLAQSFASEDRLLRRNVAMVLGNIGDARAAAALLLVAKTDADETVRTAAQQSATRIGAKGDALSAYLALGDAYHHGRSDVLGPRGAGDVVWRFTEGKLVPEPVPPSLFNDEMAIQAYTMAIKADPSSVAALAGLGRSVAAERAELAGLEKAGQDVSAFKARSASAQALVNSAGVPALDTALAWSVKGGDSTSGAAMAESLGDLATAPTPGLQAALRSGDGAMAAESAVALGNIAVRSATSASPEVVGALSQAVGREIQRVAAVIGDSEAAQAVAAALEKSGNFVSRWSTGAKGSTMARRAAGIDVIILAETLPDLTAAQVLDELKADDRTKAVPVVLLAKDPAAASTMYGDKLAGATTGATDMAAIDAALGKTLDGDRARAETLAARASETLAYLARGGRTDVSAAIPALAAASARADAIAIPAFHALGAAAGAGEAANLVAVLADEKRSEPARAAAGDALAAILGRTPTALDAAGLAQVATVASAANGAASVREAASRALGRAQMDPAARAELLSKLRG